MRCGGGLDWSKAEAGSCGGRWAGLRPGGPTVSLPANQNGGQGCGVGTGTLLPAGLTLPLWPTDIVNKDAKSTLRVLYSLFCKHKLKVDKDGRPQAPTN